MKELDEIRKEIKDVSVKIADVQREQCRIERMFTKASEQKPAHKWEAGQWAHWDCGNGNSTDFKVRSTTAPCLCNGTAFYGKQYCIPIPAPAFEIGHEVALKGNGMIFAITSRHWNNDTKRWLYDEHDESELTAQLPKFKVGDEVVTYDIEHKQTIIFKAHAIDCEWIYRKDGYRYPTAECRHLVSMQVEGETEIKPGRWVRMPVGWEGLAVFQNDDGDWHVIKPAHGGGGLFKSSSLTLLNRPPEVLK